MSDEAVKIIILLSLEQNVFFNISSDKIGNFPLVFLLHTKT